MFVKSTPDCSRPSRFTSQSSFAVMLDPILKLQNKQAIAYKKAEMKEMMSRLNQKKAFTSIFATLWYASLPCFDVRNITASWNGDRSLLRYCEWKGIQISCSAIFTSFPTDKGMCCSFNMKAADEIYTQSPYRDILQTMQVSISHFTSSFFGRKSFVQCLFFGERIYAQKVLVKCW